MIAGLPIESRPSDGFRHFEVSATDHGCRAMNRENTTGPAAWPILRDVVADPPLIRFDCDDVQDFFSSAGHAIRGRNAGSWELVLPGLTNRIERGFVLLREAWFVAIPAGNSRVAMPKVDRIPVRGADFLAQRVAKFLDRVASYVSQAPACGADEGRLRQGEFGGRRGIWARFFLVDLEGHKTWTGEGFLPVTVGRCELLENGAFCTDLAGNKSELRH